jgi:hypothetical protein
MGVYLGRAGQAGGAMEVEQIALCRSKNSDLCVLFGANSLGLGDFPSTGVLRASLFPNYQRSLRGGKRAIESIFFSGKRFGNHTRTIRTNADSNSYNTCAVTTQL